MCECAIVLSLSSIQRWAFQGWITVFQKYNTESKLILSSNNAFIFWSFQAMCIAGVNLCGLSFTWNANSLLTNVQLFTCDYSECENPHSMEILLLGNCSYKIGKVILCYCVILCLGKTNKEKLLYLILMNIGRNIFLNHVSICKVIDNCWTNGAEGRNILFVSTFIFL